MPLNDTHEQIHQALDLWNNAFSKMKSLQIPLEQDLTPVKRSANQINDRFLTMIEFILALKAEKKAVLLLPIKLIAQLHAGASRVREAAAAVLQQLTNVEVSGGVQSFDPATMNLQATNATTHDLNQPLTVLLDTADALLLLAAQVIPFVHTKGIEDLTQRARKLQGLGIELDKIVQEHRKAEGLLQERLKSADQVLTQITEQLATASNHKTQAADAAVQIANSLAEAKAKTEQIKEISSNASTLETQVADYSAKFDAFEKQLEGRLKTLKDADIATQEAERLNKERETKIDTLIDQSDSLLKGATVSGLATSFQQQATEYKNAMTNSRRWFNSSIAFLVFSTIPLALYVLPIEIPVDFSFKEFLKGNGPISVGGILSRLLLLLPATWMTGFNSKRYSEMFHLYQQYAHKSTIAQSLHGFKKEAPKYEQEITGGVFLDLKAPPTASNAKEEDQSPNPILNFLIEKARTIFTAKEDKPK